MQARFSDPMDRKDVFLTVQAGAGGTESCDWAEMLLRMYSRWMERRGYSMRLVDTVPGDEAGIRSATLEVAGEWLYGMLRGEAGVHRLVRISPFDANKRRHTSFAAVDVMPKLEDDVAVEINEADLRIDTFRAKGAGGQKVNKTSSAVRIVHNPTGIVVQCQNERSQHQNRKIAMEMLRARLYQLKRKEREDQLNKLIGEKGEIAWGSQIRSYVLHPYTMVKDHRTDLEVSDVRAVLDGEIDAFLEAYLLKKMQREPAKEGPARR